jgi:branched-chain amino acid transport system permease protein
VSPLIESRGFHAVETLPWLAALALFVLWPEYASLATAILVMVLFAVSLDLLTGYAGIVTLGHSIFFGVGAYGAGLIAKSGWTEPVTGLLVAATISSACALPIGLLLSRLRGLILIMTTLALGLIFYEVAKSASSITGGDDGLQGFAVAPLFGWFPWTVYGQTAFFYALFWVFILFVFARKLTASPYGMALRGLRENFGRMQLLGGPVNYYLVVALVISGFLAGAAGALSAQTTSFVDLNVLSLDNSAAVLVMLVLGGLGRLYGAIVGVVLFMLVRDIAAKIDPYNWMFVIGALLVVVVLFSNDGILGMARTGSDFVRKTLR